jgi:serine protease AprX
MKRLLIFIFMIFVGSTVLARSPKISKDLDSNRAGDLLDVIVQFKQLPTAKHHQKAIEKGGQFKKNLGLVNGGLYSLPVNALEALAADTDVAYISPDRPVAASLDYATAAVGMDVARSYGYDGAGIGVAVIDSGIADIPDLHTGGYRVVYAESFCGDSTTVDPYGHGTHVVGILAGNGKNSTGSKYFHTFKGMAPMVNIINLRVLDQNGVGTDSAVIAAIDRAIALKSQYNIRVMNLSLGRAVHESYIVDPLCQAVERAWKAGIIVVVSAGNGGRDDSQGTQGYATIHSPANDPYVITVGAMKTGNTLVKTDDTIASYSSKGPTLFDHVVKPDLVAPGNRIISLYKAGLTLPNNYPGNKTPYSYYQIKGNSSPSSTYYTLSGTSMSAPIVSGAVAIILQNNPSLTPDQVKARLMKTASKAFPATSTATDPLTGTTYTSQYDIFTVGAGYLDIVAALASSDLAAGPALSPTAVYDSASGNVYLVSDSSAVWGSTAVWDNAAVWGTNVFADRFSAVWGTNVVADRFSAVWGTSAVWGNSSILGFSAVWGNGTLWGTSTTPAGEATKVAIQGED